MPKRAEVMSAQRETVEVRKSPIHGRGVYARKTIPKGTRIIEYTGKRIPWKDALEAPPQFPDEPFHTFYFGLENDEVIDAGKGGNEARWINHSCVPNCETAEENHRIFVDALRMIRRGEELYYDYRIVPGERRTKQLERQYICRCGSTKCRGTMLEPKQKRRKRQTARKVKLA